MCIVDIDFNADFDKGRNTAKSSPYIGGKPLRYSVVSLWQMTVWMYYASAVP